MAIGFLPTPSSSLDILNRNEHFNTSHFVLSQNPNFPVSKMISFGSAGKGVLRHIPKSALLEKAAADATQVWEEATKESPEYSSASGLSQRWKEIHPKSSLPEKTADAAQVWEEATKEIPEYSSVSGLSQRWKEFHGSNNWEGMLEPNLHPDLRRVILRYGEFAQATYDAFDFDSHCKYCGSCKHGRQRFLEKVGLSHVGYTVSKYLYAMSDVHLPSWFLRSHADASERWSDDSNWMGYVAVATDEKEISRLGRRDIVIAWRGTVTFLEWLQDVDQHSVHPCEEAGTDFDVYVERGFWSLFTSKGDKTRYNKQSAFEQVMEEVKRLLEEFKDEQVSITITGHSLGGALALLSAYKISQFCADNFSSDQASLPWISVFTFGGPRVGNEGFKRKLEESGVKTLRIVNENDAVPKVPGVVLNEGLWQPAKQALGWALEKIMKRRYVHAGVKLVVNNLHSPFLKPDGSLPDFHNLEAYLHLVDGYQGVKGDEFRSETGRDIALINKSSGFLKKEMLVPPCWYQMENKGLVRNEDGKWIQPPREEEDLPHLHK